MSEKKKKILLIRLDKIGDLICTLCVDQIPEMSNYETHWVISSGLGFIPLNSEPQRKFIELSKKWSWKSFFSFYIYIKNLQPDIAVSFQCPAWINLVFFLAFVPQRSGVLSQWHSFLFLNKGLRQRRSQAIKHEAEYNLELLCHALDREPIPTVPLLKMNVANNENLFSKFNLSPQKYIVVHPGMAGSALNWTLDKYLEYVDNISKTTQVVLTGTQNDEKWIKPLEESFQNNPHVISLKEKLSPTDLLVILKHAQKVIAPSTGVLHLAASLGTETIGIYSPIKVHHPKRWGARGLKVKNLVPAVICPEQFHCAYTNCKYYNCMQKIEL